MEKTTGFKKLLLVGLLITGSAVGAGDMAFRGVLITPPLCTINDGNQIDVNFGDKVGVSKVDGENYRQSMNYQINCNNVSNSPWSMTLALIGNATVFDQEALLTNNDNLGIRIYQNGEPFRPGSELVINSGSPPHLEAVPVKKAGATLRTGAFEAWATLKVDYQ